MLVGEIFVPEAHKVSIDICSETVVVVGAKYQALVLSATKIVTKVFDILLVCQVGVL